MACLGGVGTDGRKLQLYPRNPGGFSWLCVDTTTRMSLVAGGEDSTAVAQPSATERHCVRHPFPEGLLCSQPVELVGDFGGAGIDGQQALQLPHRQVGLAGLGVDLREVLGGGAVTLVELERAPELGDGGPSRPRV